METDKYELDVCIAITPMCLFIIVLQNVHHQPFDYNYCQKQ